MKIAILGTRGIPNNYGGFEQNAENLSVFFNQRGHMVTVYNPDDHPYAEATWNGVNIHRVFCGERRLRLGIWGTLTYDYMSLAHASRQGYDILLEMGYVPSGVFYRTRPRRGARIVTNVDGMEWRRSKWSPLLRRFARWCEREAVQLSHALISDNPGIRDYIKSEYGRDSHCIPYGAQLFHDPREEYLHTHQLSPYGYYMLVARLEPENNIEMILDGFLSSQSLDPFVVVGSTRTTYGSYLLNKYADKNAKFLGAVYDYDVLSSLRWFSKIYFHGHSVGGTNPSLLEAMASNALIAAFNCVFNRHVLGSDARYFSDSHAVSSIIRSYSAEVRDVAVRNNREKIRKVYNWDVVGEQYLRVFEQALV